MGFDDCEHYDFVGAPTFTANDEEEVRVLARACNDEFSVCKNDLRFMNLFCIEAKVVDCRVVTVALHSAFEAVYRL